MSSLPVILIRSSSSCFILLSRSFSWKISTLTAMSSVNRCGHGSNLSRPHASQQELPAWCCLHTTLLAYTSKNCVWNDYYYWIFQTKIHHLLPSFPPSAEHFLLFTRMNTHRNVAFVAAANAALVRTTVHLFHGNTIFFWTNINYTFKYISRHIICIQIHVSAKTNVTRAQYTCTWNKTRWADSHTSYLQVRVFWFQGKDLLFGDWEGYLLIY